MTNSSANIKNRFYLLAIEGLAFAARTACGRVVLALVRLQHCLLHNNTDRIRQTVGTSIFRSVKISMPRQAKAVKSDDLDVLLDNRPHLA